MKSTGEVMSIGRTIEESLHKAIRSLISAGMDLKRFPSPGMTWQPH